MPVKRLKRTHDLAAHSEWSQALGNLWHFPSRWTHLALGIRNPCFFFGCTGPRLLCMEASLSYSKQELLSVAVHGLLGAQASIAAPQHARSFWTRDWTHDPCTSRQILNHWPTREVPRSTSSSLRSTGFSFTSMVTPPTPASGCLPVCAGSGHTPQVSRGTTHPFNCPSHAMILYPFAFLSLSAPPKAFLIVARINAYLICHRIPGK